MSLVTALRYLFPDADPTRDYEIRDDGAGPFLAAWRLPDPQPNAAAVSAAAAAYDAAQAQRQTEHTALRQQVITLAQSAVGQPVNALTAAQVRAIVALLLYKAGALDTSGNVAALSSWLV